METLIWMWSLPPVRWAVWLGAALAISYVVAAKVWRWANDDDRVTRGEKIITGAFWAVVGVFSWLFNWTVAPCIWWDSGPAWPSRWDEMFTERLQRTLDHPERYPPRAVYLARKLKPWMNKRHKGHLE